MTFLTVNPIAILLGGVANMALGMLWYSPLLFGNQWMKYMHLTMKKLEKIRLHMGVTYGISLVTALLQAFILHYLFIITASATVFDGIVLGAVTGIGFIATSMLTSVLYEQKPVGLYLINAGYQVLSLLITGAIIGVLH